MSVQTDISPDDPQQTLGTANTPWDTTYTRKIADANGRVMDAATIIDATIREPGTTDHAQLENRDQFDQHPAQAVTYDGDRLDTKLDAMRTDIDSKAPNQLASSEQDGLLSSADYDLIHAPGGNVVHNDTTGRDEADAHPATAITYNGSTTELVGRTVTDALDQTYQLADSKTSLQAIPNASPDERGLMTSADKSKLDNVPTNVADSLAGKADLGEDGKVLPSQLPPAVTPTTWDIASEDDLITLTDAVVNDYARVVNSGTVTGTFVLIALPPTTRANWADLSGGGGGGVVSVNGKEGVVSIGIADLPDVQTAINAKADTTYVDQQLGTKADASALTAYATTQDLNDGLDTKVNTTTLQSDYYSRTQADALLDDKADLTPVSGTANGLATPDLYSLKQYGDLTLTEVQPANAGSNVINITSPKIVAGRTYLIGFIAPKTFEQTDTLTVNGVATNMQMSDGTKSIPTGLFAAGVQKIASLNTTSTPYVLTFDADPRGSRTGETHNATCSTTGTVHTLTITGGFDTPFPAYFTVRTTMDQDYTAGNTFRIGQTTFTPYNQANEPAPTGIVKTGAMVEIMFDTGRVVCFFKSGSGGGGGPGEGWNIFPGVTPTSGSVPGLYIPDATTPSEVNILSAVDDFSPAADIVQFDNNSDHSLVLLTNGEVWSTGSNYYGQLGRTLVNATNDFEWGKIDLPLKAVDIGAGIHFSMILLEDGTVWTCGRNDRGQLGRVETRDGSSAIINGGIIPNLSNVVNIYAAGNGYAIIDSGVRDPNSNERLGEVYSWGSGILIGNGSSENGSPTSPNVQKVEFSSEGYSWYIPINNYFAYGNQLAAPARKDIQVSSCNDFVAYNAYSIDTESGTGYSVGTRLFTCGANDYGQLGYTTAGTTSSVATPFIVQGENRFAGQGRALSRSLIILSPSAYFYGCGYNAHGELGVAKQSDRYNNIVHTRISNSTDLDLVWNRFKVSVSACFAERIDGDIVSWGTVDSIGRGEDAPIGSETISNIGQLFNNLRWSIYGHGYSFFARDERGVWYGWGSPIALGINHPNEMVYSPIELSFPWNQPLPYPEGALLISTSDTVAENPIPLYDDGYYKVNLPVTGAYYSETGTAEPVEYMADENGVYVPSVQDPAMTWVDGLLQSGGIKDIVVMRNSDSPITLGSSATLFLLENGDVYFCGRNGPTDPLSTGQPSTQIGSRDNPNITKYMGLPPISKISASRDHILFLTHDGKLYSCGYNNYGQSGRATGTNAAPLAIVPLEYRVDDIRAGIFSSWWRNADNKLWYNCGRNDNGFLVRLNAATGSNTDPSIGSVPDSDTWIDVCHSSFNTVSVIDSDRRVYTAGSNGYGALCRTVSHGTAANPQYGVVPYFTDNYPIENISSAYCCFTIVTQLKDTPSTNRGFYNWGLNNYGQLGRIIKTGSATTINPGRAISGLVGNVFGYNDDGRYFIGLYSAGQYRGWGYNANGEAGGSTSLVQGNESAINMTPLMGNISDFINIFPGASMSFRQRNDKSCIASGQNIYGGMGVPGALDGTFNNIRAQILPSFDHTTSYPNNSLVISTSDQLGIINLYSSLKYILRGNIVSVGQIENGSIIDRQFRLVS